MTSAVDKLEDQAREVLEALGMWRVPVDPLAIAREEGIELEPGTFGLKFDARIEYLPPVRTFVIYYKRPGPGRPEGRVHFSIGHELGHFYIPEHRERLLKGQVHNSVCDYRSKDPAEVEADAFAAGLLMPRELFVNKVYEHRQGVCVLSELCRMAENVFRTSVMSTVLRYCRCDLEASAVIISEGGKVKWAEASYDMRRLGMGYVAAGSRVPAGTKTAELWTSVALGRDSSPLEGTTLAARWYEKPYRRIVWEEAMPLGNTGLVLTYLTLQDAD